MTTVESAQSPQRRFLLVVLVGVLPWTLVGVRGAWTVVHPLGLINLDPPQNVVWITTYLFEAVGTVPPFFETWPIGVVFYAFALVSAAGGLVGREDRRVTAGLLVLVGATQFLVTWEFFTLPTRTAYLAVPVATVTTFVLVWWVYWPPIRASLAT